MSNHDCGREQRDDDVDLSEHQRGKNLEIFTLERRFNREMCFYLAVHTNNNAHVLISYAFLHGKFAFPRNLLPGHDPGLHEEEHSRYEHEGHAHEAQAK